MKITTITGPDGQAITVKEESRGCMWWFGTAALLLFLVGLIMVYPILIVPTVVILAISVAYFIQRRSQ